MDKLKNYWNISSTNQLFLILMVFTVNGSLSGFIAKPLLSFFGIIKGNIHSIFYWLIYFLVITIVYFTLLILTSKLFGQTSFFKEFAKKSLSRFGLKSLF